MATCKIIFNMHRLTCIIYLSYDIFVLHYSEFNPRILFFLYKDRQGFCLETILYLIFAHFTPNTRSCALIKWVPAESDGPWGQWSFSALTELTGSHVLRSWKPQITKIPVVSSCGSEQLTGLKVSRPKLPLLFRLPISVWELDWDIPSKKGLNTH